MIDSHAHLNYPELRNAIDEIIQRAKGAGVDGIVSICTKLEEISEIKTLVNKYPDYLWYSIGIHPDYARSELAKYGEESIYNTLISDGAAVGIGECGFDFRNGDSEKKEQRKVFQIHIDAAIKNGRVLIIHTRNAESETKSVLLENKSLQKVLIHCFSGTREFARFALDMGYYISFSGIVTFKNAKEVQEVAKFVPTDRLLIETDAPFLAPTPLRGKANEPSYVRYTAEYIAKLKGISVEDLSEITTDNFKKIFLY